MARGPVITLVAVFALGAALLGVNVAASVPTPALSTAAESESAPAPAEAPEAASPGSAASPGTAPARRAFPAKARYGGVTAGGRAVPVTIWVDGGRARIYVCDNREIEQWLYGTARDGVVAATGENGGRLDGRYSEGKITGTVQVAGYPDWSFTARPR